MYLQFVKLIMHIICNRCNEIYFRGIFNSKVYTGTSTQEPLRGSSPCDSQISANPLTGPLNQGSQHIVKWKSEKQMNSLKGPLMHICFTLGLPLRRGNYAYCFREEVLVATALVSSCRGSNVLDTLTKNVYLKNLKLCRSPDERPITDPYSY